MAHNASMRRALLLVLAAGVSAGCAARPEPTPTVSPEAAEAAVERTTGIRLRPAGQVDSAALSNLRASYSGYGYGRRVLVLVFDSQEATLLLTKAPGPRPYFGATVQQHNVVVFVSGRRTGSGYIARLTAALAAAVPSV